MKIEIGQIWDFIHPMDTLDDRGCRVVKFDFDDCPIVYSPKHKGEFRTDLSHSNWKRNFEAEAAKRFKTDLKKLLEE